MSGIAPRPWPFAPDLGNASPTVQFSDVIFSCRGHHLRLPFCRRRTVVLPPPLTPVRSLASCSSFHSAAILVTVRVTVTLTLCRQARNPQGSVQVARSLRVSDACQWMPVAYWSECRLRLHHWWMNLKRFVESTLTPFTGLL